MGCTETVKRLTSIHRNWELYHERCRSHFSAIPRFLFSSILGNDTGLTRLTGCLAAVTTAGSSVV